jgi:hypothetical protein
MNGVSQKDGMTAQGMKDVDGGGPSNLPFI